MADFKLPDNAEASICGCLLLNPETKDVAASLITEDDFVDPFYGAIFSVVMNNENVDGFMLREKMKEKGHELPDNFFRELTEVAIYYQNMKAYCELLRKESQRRSLSALVGDVFSDAADDKDPTEIIERAEKRLKKISEGGIATKTFNPTDLANKFFAHRERVDQGNGAVSTGFAPVDRMLSGGMLRSCVYILAARPGMGKTTLALQVADHIAETGAVLFVSLEMSVEQLQGKRIARVAGLASNKVLLERIDNEEDYARIVKASEKLASHKFYANAEPSASVADIGRMAKRIKDLRCIVIDYLGLITPSDKRVSKYEAVTNISRDLKQLATKLDVPLLVLAQLNRENTARNDKRPQASDLRDSGAIEQDADGIIMLHRDDYYDDKDADSPTRTWDATQIEVIVRKNRFGQTGTCKAVFFPATGRIVEDTLRR